MCGIALTFSPNNDIAIQLATEEHCSSPLQRTSYQNVTTSSTFSDDVSSLEKCVMEGIAPRGPDLPYSRRQYRVVFTKEVVDCDLNNTLEKYVDPKDKVMCCNGDDDSYGVANIHPVMRVALPTTNNYDNTTSLDWILNLYASVLHMRGSAITPQPYVIKGSGDQNDEYDYAFCWNGECYSFWDDEEGGKAGGVSKENSFDAADDGERSDTEFVMKTLKNSIEKSRVAPLIQRPDSKDCSNLRISNRSREHLEIARVLGKVHGEYSFILLCAPCLHDDKVIDPDKRHHIENGLKVTNQIRDKGCIYFGRDPMGRRSLLMTKVVTNAAPQNCSTGAGNEVEQGDTLTCITDDVPVVSSFAIASVALTSHKWECSHELLQTDSGNQKFSDNEKEELNRMAELEEIIAGRVYCLDLNSGLISFTTIPPSYKQGLTSSTQTISQKNKYDKENDRNMQIPTHINDAAECLYSILDRAVRRRVINAPKANARYPNATDTNKKRRDASVAILFSGGVDSVVLAALCQNHIPCGEPIDLINVAFASSSSTQEKNNTFSSSPDRQAALLSYYEMKARWPSRDWRFIAVDVDYSEVLEHEKIICGLVAPLSSTMDFNVGTAFWFATRGRGMKEEGQCETENNSLIESDNLKFARNESKHISGHKSDCVKNKCSMLACEHFAKRGCIFGACKFCCSSYQKPISGFLQRSARICAVHNIEKKVKVKSKEKFQSYCKMSNTTKNLRKTITSNAKVVLVGIGADEQMAGYARHRSTYERGGYDALRAELQMEKDRLWTRNLGRDDRCISYHGKEARFPFLDEDVVGYLNSLDILQICDMTKPQGEGDKMILRLVAKRIGVQQCSSLVKRAIQFGSRIAKVSDVNRFGSCRKASGTAQHRASN